MMTRNFLLLYLFLISFQTFAQSEKAPATLQWGKELRDPKNTYISNIIGTTSQGTYVLRQTSTNLLTSNQQKVGIEHYDNQMKLIKAQEINLKYQNKKRELEDVIFFGKKMYLLTSFNNKGKKKNYLFAQKVDKKSLALDQDIKLLGEIDTRNKIQDGDFNHYISRDSSKLLISNLLPYKKDMPERFALRVFDNNLNELWSKDIILPYNDDKFSIEEFRIDNKGNVYLLGVIYEDRSRTRRHGKPTYRYTILAYTEKGAESKEYKIDLGDHFITDLTFRIRNDGDLVCSGFFSDKGTYSIKGTYYFKLDAKSKRIYNQNLKKFDVEFLSSFFSERKSKRIKNAAEKGDAKKETELYQYSLDDLVLRSDGGAVLIAEQYFIEEHYDHDYYDRTFNNNSSRRRTFYYNYNDIIVVNIRPNGEIQWATRIPKRQVTRDDGGYFSSYAMSIVRDKIYFVYNENGRNFETDREPNRRYNFNGSNSVIALSQINTKGELKSYPLFNNRDAGIITRPKICRQIGLKKMLIFGKRNRNYKFGTLEFL